MEEFNKLKTAVAQEVLNPVIIFLFGVALLYFLWGVVQYIRSAGSASDRQEGQSRMFWGIIGIAIMLSAFGLVNFVFNTVTEGGTVRGIDPNKPIERPKVIQDNKL